MRDVGGVDDGGITNSVCLGQIGEVALGRFRSQTTPLHRNAHILRNGGALRTREIGEEGRALDGGTVVQVDTEQIVHWVCREICACRTGTAAPVLQPRDGRERLVVDGHLVNRQIALPVGTKGGFGRGAPRGGVGAIHEGDDIGVERGDFADQARDVVEVREDAQGLVRVLVAVAPRAPVDALGPVLLEPGGIRDEVPEACGYDDAPACEHDLLAGWV